MRAKWNNPTSSSGPAELELENSCFGPIGCATQAVFPAGNAAFLVVRPENPSAPAGLTLRQGDSDCLYTRIGSP
jgi:hypothetical protein